MSDESGTGKLFTGLLAVVAIGIVGYVIYITTRSNAPSMPEVNMSREEIMKGAMVDGPPRDAATVKNEPKTASLKGKGL